jgi:hypothetical protein
MKKLTAFTSMLDYRLKLLLLLFVRRFGLDHLHRNTLQIVNYKYIIKRCLFRMPCNFPAGDIVC